MNFCRRCESEYERPGTCNCFAEKAPRENAAPVPAIGPHYPIWIVDPRWNYPTYPYPGLPNYEPWTQPWITYGTGTRPPETVTTVAGEFVSNPGDAMLTLYDVNGRLRDSSGAQVQASFTGGSQA